jgi:NADH:ubiquinone oxidoreductase subunit
MHHTIDRIPSRKMKIRTYLWQKKHLENQTGTKDSYKPIKIKREDVNKKYETWK